MGCRCIECALGLGLGEGRWEACLLDCACAPQWTAGTARTGCPSSTMDTPLLPRSSSPMCCTPSRSTPLWPQSEWGWGPRSAWLQLSPVTEGRGSRQLPCPHAACFIFVLPFLSYCLLEPLLPKLLSFLHPWPTLFMGPSLYLVEYSQDVPILKKITSLALPDISRSCQPLFLHSPENCLSCVPFYNSLHPNLCSLVSATSLKGSSGPLQ